MHPLTLAERRTCIGSRARQRMTENDLIPRNQDDSRLFRGLQRFGLDVQPAPSAHDQPKSQGIFRGRHQQQQLGLVRQPADLLQIHGPDRAPLRPHINSDLARDTNPDPAVSALDVKRTRRPGHGASWLLLR